MGQLPPPTRPLPISHSEVGGLFKLAELGATRAGRQDSGSVGSKQSGQASSRGSRTDASSPLRFRYHQKKFSTKDPIPQQRLNLGQVGHVQPKPESRSRSRSIFKERGNKVKYKAAVPSRKDGDRSGKRPKKGRPSKKTTKCSHRLKYIELD